MRRSAWRPDPERQAILLRGRRKRALSAEVNKVLDDLKLSRHCPLTSRGVSGSRHAVPFRGVQPSKASTRSVTSFGSPDLPGLAKDTDTEELPQASFQRIRGAAQPKEPLGSVFHNGNAKQHARCITEMRSSTLGGWAMQLNARLCFQAVFTPMTSFAYNLPSDRARRQHQLVTHFLRGDCAQSVRQTHRV